MQLSINMLISGHGITDVSIEAVDVTRLTTLLDLSTETDPFDLSHPQYSE